MSYEIKVLQELDFTTKKYWEEFESKLRVIVERKLRERCDALCMKWEEARRVPRQRRQKASFPRTIYRVYSQRNVPR